MFIMAVIARHTEQNSSKDIFPSPSASAWMIVLSTICWSWASLRLLPTIIFNTCKENHISLKDIRFVGRTSKVKEGVLLRKVSPSLVLCDHFPGGGILELPTGSSWEWPFIVYLFWE